MSIPFPSLGDAAELRPHPMDRKHLWVFASGRTDDGIVMFNITTWKKNHSDETCIVTSADHGYIDHRSVIEYRRGILLTEEKWERILENADCEMKTRASKAFLRKIQLGALDPKGRTAGVLQDMVRPFLVTL